MSQELIHVVRSAILDDGDSLLLVRRSLACRNNPGGWELPGGKVDSGETELQAIAREVIQETGLVIAPTGSFVTAELRPLRGNNEDGHYLVRSVTSLAVGGQLRLGHEHIDAFWAPPEEALGIAGLTESTQRAIRMLGNLSLSQQS